MAGRVHVLIETVLVFGKAVKMLGLNVLRRSWGCYVRGRIQNQHGWLRFQSSISMLRIKDNLSGEKKDFTPGVLGSFSFSVFE